MRFAQRLTELIQACFSGIWVESHEHDDALMEIATLCREQRWQLMTWDIEQGLMLAGTNQLGEGTSTDPLAAIRSLAAIENQQDSSCLLVLRNFHRFLQSAEIVQALLRQLSSGKQNRTFVIVLSPVIQIPVELERQITVIEHDLPDREQLESIARGIATSDDELPPGPELQRLLDAAAGLTRYEAENAFSLSLVQHGQLQAQTLWELKAQMLKKSALLQLHRGGESFADLGGLDSLKTFCKRALRPIANAIIRPRGVLLLSPPGCGKSQFAKALGAEVDRPTLILDIGALMGSLVGQTEQNVRQALRIVDAMAPAVVFLDECEKAFAGANGQGDSGVAARLFGTFLSWLNDRESNTFVVATANDISRLPPEFSRAERFDGVFFLDLPGHEQRHAIWQLYLAKYRLDSGQKLPADANWTGAEIKSCCRLAALLDVPLMAAAQNIVPVAVTSAEAIDRLRTWASGRCLSADSPGTYLRQTGPTTRRRVSRDPSNN